MSMANPQCVISLAPRQHFTVRFALVICAYTILAATEAVLSLFDWAVG